MKSDVISSYLLSFGYIKFLRPFKVNPSKSARQLSGVSLRHQGGVGRNKGVLVRLGIEYLGYACRHPLVMTCAKLDKIR